MKSLPPQVTIQTKCQITTRRLQPTIFLRWQIANRYWPGPNFLYTTISDMLWKVGLAFTCCENITNHSGALLWADEMICFNWNKVRIQTSYNWIWISSPTSPYSANVIILGGNTEPKAIQIGTQCSINSMLIQNLISFQTQRPHRNSVQSKNVQSPENWQSSLQASHRIDVSNWSTYISIPSKSPNKHHWV